MTDSVRCSVDSSQGGHVVNCEVDIGPDDPSPAPAAAPAPPSPGPPSPAVTAPVDRLRVVDQHAVHAPEVDELTAASAKQCLGQLISLAPLFLVAPKNTLTGALAGLKVSYDLAACFGKDQSARQTVADQRAAVAECESNDGVVLGEANHTLTCEVPARVSP